MMATVPPPFGLLPLLESLEDAKAGQSEQTDAYLTIANRLSGEDGRQFLPVVVKHFTRLGKAMQTHISSENVELSQAALQALGFCVFHSHIVSAIPATFCEETLSALAGLVVKSTDKNTCTRALWVISKQNFSVDVVARKAPEILKTLEAVRTREDIQSVVMEHEALNVIIRLLEQVSAQMVEGAVQWARLVIPLVVHSAAKVRLRAAAALEMGMPLLLEKQQEVAAIVEPMMSSKIIPELQKLFSNKNETNVLKLWPLFVRLLGKVLHRGGSFINSLLYLEELGFRSSSPSIKKIAFIAWKSLIDNFALNPDILCSSKRLKLLMQPLSSIHVRTEALLLTKLEVWWYLVVKLGPNLVANFEQVGIPLLQSTLPADAPLLSPVTPARNSTLNSTAPATPKTGIPACNSPAATPRINLNCSVQSASSFPSIQLLGLEMVLHYLLGAQVATAAAQAGITLSLEPLAHPLLTGHSSFTKHSCVLISAVRDGFIVVGNEAPEPMLIIIWKGLLDHVNLIIDAGGNKNERQGSDVLSQLLQALQAVLSSDVLPVARALALLEVTVKGIPQKVLGSAAYQVANMDVLNGTPALFLILLFYKSSLLPKFVEDERFFSCLETLVSSGLSGPTSLLVFVEAVIGAMNGNVSTVESKEHLWRMWSIVVNPLTDAITQTNEVNQGDALEHNFNAMHSSLMFPVPNLLLGKALPQATKKSMISTWSRLYIAFARCAALVATAEENVCCEELCSKMAVVLDSAVLSNFFVLEAVANILQIIIECVDFSPYTTQYQQKKKSPRTPLGRVRKKGKALGNLSTFLTLLVRSLEAFLTLDSQEFTVEVSALALGGVGTVLICILSKIFTSVALPTVIQEVISTLIQPLTWLYSQVGRPTQTWDPSSYQYFVYFGSHVLQLERFLGEMLGCFQSRSTLQYDDDLLTLLAPLFSVLFSHRSKNIRTSVAQFWNATFGNAVVLNYPDELKPVLTQVKQKIPIILPTFQAVEESEGFRGQHSSESSQMETEISGLKVMSVGKRDSLPNRAAVPKSSATPCKPVSIRLDFGSPKPPRREVLEEEASIDFVFIPPETKDRVLTEHQKEVKRTKRVDIPVMYNNLDASLDTTVFTQCMQSQEESLDSVPVDEKIESSKIDKTESEVEGVKGELKLDGSTSVIPLGSSGEKSTNAAELPFTGDVFMEDLDKASSHNDSGTSDVVSGTPQKSGSRRQSFITLEKFAEGRPASPVSISKFTGPFTRTSNSQGTPSSSKIQANQQSTQENDSPESSKSQSSFHQDLKVEELKAKAESLDEGVHERSEHEEDVIPDTQTTTVASKPESLLAEKVDYDDEKQSDCDAKDSGPFQDHSEVRRSGRCRRRPVRPGEDQDDHKIKFSPNSPANDQQSNLQESIKSPPTQGKKSKVVVELENTEAAKRMSPRAMDLSQNEAPPDSADGQTLGRLRRRTRELSQSDSQPDSQSPGDAQALSRLRRRTKELSQTESPTQADDKLKGRVWRRSQMLSDTDALNKDCRSACSEASPREGLSQSSTDSEVNGESQVRPRRSRRSESSNAHNEGLSHGRDSDQIGNDPKRGRHGLRKQDAECVRTENSQVNESVESQNEQGRYNTRRFSQLLMPVHERSESGASENRDGQKPAKRGRKPKSLSAEFKQSPPSNEHVGEGLEVQHSQSPVPGNEGISAKVPAENQALQTVENEDQEEVVSDHLEPSSEAKHSTMQVEPESNPDGDAGSVPLKTDECENELADHEGIGKVHPVKVSSDAEEDVSDRNLSGCDTAVASCEAVRIESGSDCLQREHDEPDSPPCKSAVVQCLDFPEKTLENEAFTPEKVQEEMESFIQDVQQEMVEELQKNPDDRLQNSSVNQEEESINTDQETSLSVEGVTPLLAEEGEDTQVDCELLPPPVDVPAGPSLPDDRPEDLHSGVSNDVGLDSPPTQKNGGGAGGEPEVGQSPSSGKTLGVWSPSASPSTSILKKCHKRHFEEDTPSPLPKTRRVSFADPIYQQELADDIDRRSPIIRTSSPRSKSLSGPPKFITTPTKGLALSPRSLRCPGYKSSKKCLISEMSQEPRPIPKDCVFPALVSCSTPVEAVLPQISSNMWPRGFGQFVRARNIKTVGDLSALTPSVIKTLPIRSPKLMNVKKALKTFHDQQRKGRSDELKGFDEMEKMTSEDMELTQNEEEKNQSESPGEAMLDVPDGVEPQFVVPPSNGLLREVQALGGLLSAEELSHYSPDQLAQMHNCLGTMMKSIMDQMVSICKCKNFADILSIS
uniref:Telomere-associated protein Rif1 N-terminal domain-containing protein n=1 Tax=Denticeps clupeoides TaxID=299321 RepID=A0AAY4C4W2_9TELE